MLYLPVGIAFGVRAAITREHLQRVHESQMTPFGVRSLAGGLERLTRGQFGALGWALVGVCAVDVGSGALLWHGMVRAIETPAA